MEAIIILLELEFVFVAMENGKFQLFHVKILFTGLKMLDMVGQVGPHTNSYESYL